MEESDEELAALLLHYVRQEDWQTKANCRGLGADAFVLDRGVSPDLAYMTCAGCTVRAECKAFQVRTGSVGIWGGELTSEPPTNAEVGEANRKVNHQKIVMQVSRKSRPA